MIVRDAGDAWQVVLQTDHADLSAQFVQAWGGDGFARPRPFESVLTAAERHDDGWAVWEQAPLVDPETGKPLNFLDVHVPAHLAFYRAGITSITDQDPYAGLLASMHGAGIYRQRYGTQPQLKLSHQEDVKEQVDAFVREQEDGYPRRMAELGVADDERWANYRLLQMYDRFSLYFCMKDVEVGEADTIGPSPRDYGGNEVEFRFEPLGPRHVRIAPYPFAKSPMRFWLLRRMLPKRARTGEEFRREFFALAPERVEFTIES